MKQNTGEKTRPQNGKPSPHGKQRHSGGEDSRAQTEEHTARSADTAINRPRQLPIIGHDHKIWYFDKRLKQIRNVQNPSDYEDLNDDELFIFEHQDLLQRICNCTDSSTAEMIHELPGKITRGEKNKQRQDFQE